MQIWYIDFGILTELKTDESATRYTSAKFVLVGESNVGKSCLAMRLAEDRYPEDHEHGTTHRMRFWLMEAEELHASAKPPEGQRRDVVLWDFGGQDEYQLVHQMFARYDAGAGADRPDSRRSRIQQGARMEQAARKTAWRATCREVTRGSTG